MNIGDLTSREAQIEEIQAHGYDVKEIGSDFLGIAWETVRKIISNLKPKRGYQKNTELVADYWCRRFGTTLEEQRAILVEKIESAKEPLKKGLNAIVALIASSALLYGAVSNERQDIRRPQRGRCQVTRIIRTRRI